MAGVVTAGSTKYEDPPFPNVSVVPQSRCVSCGAEGQRPLLISAHQSAASPISSPSTVLTTARARLSLAVPLAVAFDLAATTLADGCLDVFTVNWGTAVQQEIPLSWSQADQC